MPDGVRVGLFGGGTVGGGVYEICEAQNKAFLESIGADVKITKICVQNASKVRDNNKSDWFKVKVDGYRDWLPPSARFHTVRECVPHRSV